MMGYLETISKVALAGLAVWRLTRTVYTTSAPEAVSEPVPAYGQASAMVRVPPQDIPSGRVMDFLYWIGVWMSAQTTLWVVCGFTGVLLNWLAYAGLARALHRSKELPRTAAMLNSPSPLNSLARKVGDGAAQLCL